MTDGSIHEAPSFHVFAIQSPFMVIMIALRQGVKVSVEVIDQKSVINGCSVIVKQGNESGIQRRQKVSDQFAHACW